jgi:hypothetical protein
MFFPIRLTLTTLESGYVLFELKRFKCIPEFRTFQV